MRTIHQVIPMLHRADALGQHTLGLQAELRRRGIDSDILVEVDDPDTAHLTRPAGAFAAGGSVAEVLVYQFATASRLAPWLTGRSEPVVVNYHNVTPPEAFAPWDNGLARHQAETRADLALLAPRAVLGVAVSEFNRKDLVAAKFAATEVVPPVVPAATSAATGAEVAPPLPSGAGRPGARLLSVGRLAPNKRIEHALAGLFALRAGPDPEARLTVVGRPVVGAYSRALVRYVAHLGLGDAVAFTGAVDDARLARFYTGSDALVVTSSHEGFCLPVVEAMAHGVPVVANAEGAIPEVLGDAGLLVPSGDPRALVAAVVRLKEDPVLREDLCARARRRLAALDLFGAAPRLADLLEAVAGGALPAGSPPGGTDHTPGGAAGREVNGP